ncbi:pummelig isoform X2 [Lycorma delicatula]|uniref:pummelig isoform X2 n=1 Tax=Lycorma delicatula TaxID=130591 RepID=UPI003F516E1F
MASLCIDQSNSVDHIVCRTGIFHWLWSWWSPMSISLLRVAEKKILSCLKTAYRGCYVDIGPIVGSADKIWTIALNEESPKTPLVLLHGLGSGVALWCLNLDALAAERPVYAIDLLGFGRSSRPVFSSDPLEAEKQLVKAVEEWRKEMQIKKFILLGHSMGGFLAASYAIEYPERVNHLILADPWGFPERPKDVVLKQNIPFVVRAIAYVMQPFNPFWAIRAAGPWGQALIERMRPDLVRKFSPVLEDPSVVSQYIFQCNAQSPTGEGAFHTMMSGMGWAKNPMLKRIHLLNTTVPITLLYGGRSWIDNSAGEKIRDRRSGYVNVQMISGAGHHVYADKSDVFNRYVNEACIMFDKVGTTEKRDSLGVDSD